MQFNREGVLLLRSLDSRLSKDLPSDLQKLRCKVFEIQILFLFIFMGKRENQNEEKKKKTAKTPPFEIYLYDK